MSNFTLDEWKAIAERETRGDMVHDILKDWENDRRKPVEAKAEAGLRSELQAMVDFYSDAHGQIESWKVFERVKQILAKPRLSPAAGTEGPGLRDRLERLRELSGQRLVVYTTKELDGLSIREPCRVVQVAELEATIDCALARVEGEKK